MTHSREELVAKIKEAADHPLALLFGALGVAYPTPSKTARAARERAGLSNEEEKLAKWVAVLKRECQEIFGQDFWQALKTILQEEGKEMEVMWGEKRFMGKLRGIVKRTLGRGDIFPKMDVTPNSIQCYDKQDASEMVICVTSARLNGEVGSRFLIDGR